MVLVHHGILGQKWGIRRFQNPDGSLTEAGKIRYGDKGEYDTSRSNSPSYKSVGYLGKTRMADYKNMSKEDLKEMVERMELENRYLRAVDARRGKTYVQRMASRLNDLAQIAESTNKLLQFTTGKNFAQNIAEISDRSVKKNGISDDDISKLFDDLSYKIDRNHRPSIEVRNRLEDLGYKTDKK